MKEYKFTAPGSIKRLIVTFTCLIFLTGCSVFGLFGKDDEEQDPDIAADETAAKLYQKAHRQLIAQEFVGAIENFETLEARYPFGRHAQQAQLELAYAYHKQNNTDLALDSINRFIKLNPLHPNIDYAYYMKGLITFDSGKNLIHFVLPRDPSNNDPTSLREAFDIFNLLIDKYPESKYADDAKQRMIYLRNELAEYELKVAKFYIRRGAYVASANRAKYIMENYQGAEVMPEAVYILEQSYLKLGLNDLAEDTHRVFAQNFKTGKNGLIDQDFARETESCAEGLWSKMMEKLRFRTYYCN